MGDRWIGMASTCTLPGLDISQSPQFTILFVRPWSWANEQKNEPENKQQKSVCCFAQWATLVRERTLRDGLRF